jgi:hypothetical protein
MRLGSWPAMPEPCKRSPCTRGSPGSAKAARRGGEGPGRGPGPQAPGPAGGPDRVADGEGQAEPEGLQDLQLLDDLLTAGQRTRNVHWGVPGRWMARRPGR